MAGPRTCFVITGNETRGGEVVYLRADGSWTTALDDAHPFSSKDEAAVRLSDVRIHEDVVTEPYVFEATNGDGRVTPRSARELLRSRGPSTRLRRPD
jgi:hypothetical protein